MPVTYSVVNIGKPLPEHVFRSDMWRNLRAALAGIKTGETIIVNLGTPENPNHALNAARSAAYEYPKYAEEPCTISTSALRVNGQMPEDISAALGRNGITNGDLILEVRKNRKEVAQ